MSLMSEFFGRMGELAACCFGEQLFGGCECVFSVICLVMAVLPVEECEMGMITYLVMTDRTPTNSLTLRTLIQDMPILRRI